MKINFKNIILMKRKAIIIGSPLSDYHVSHLKGAIKDYNSVINFLQSPSGGAWENIQSGLNPNKKNVFNEISNSINEDYVLLYFSGHGSFNGENTVLQINDNETISLSEIKLYNKKIMIIIDACRIYIPTSFSSFLGDIKESYTSKLNHSEAKQIFNTYLSRCEDGIVLLNSCSINEYSYEGKNGGYFTQTLLNDSQNWTKKVDKYGIMPINNIFPQVKRKVQNLSKDHEKSQNSEIISNLKSETWFPFVIKKAIQ
jgi:hypothetical protein